MTDEAFELSFSLESDENIDDIIQSDCILYLYLVVDFRFMPCILSILEKNPCNKLLFLTSY